MKIKPSAINPESPLPFEAWASPVTLTITIAASQLHALKQLALLHGPPGTPTASLASTAFSRGLLLLLEECSLEWSPSGRSTPAALTPRKECATGDL